MGTGRLTLSESAAALLAQFARTAGDEELCAVGIGPVGHVVELHLVRNVHDVPAHAYEMEQGDLLAAYARADQQDWAVTAYVHSHPSGAAAPSATDLTAWAQTPGSVPQVIVSGDRPEDARAFTADGTRGQLELVLPDDDWSARWRQASDAQ